MDKCEVCRNDIQEGAVDLVISATFTSEPIENYIKWWCEKFNENVSIHFAAYNQVFQELLDPSGMVSENSGANLLLVRFEDFIRNIHDSEESKCMKIQRSFTDLVEILKTKKKDIPYFVGIFPVSDNLQEDKRVLRCLEDINTRWKDELESMDNVHIIDFTTLADLYEIRKVFDQVADREGHIPFTNEYYAAMGTIIARRICSWRSQTFKVIVLDCDNTLWKGICGEDGAKVEPEGPYTFLQRFMLDKKAEGMLLALCSKNNEDDVWEFFEKNEKMLLKKNDFAAWRINWQPKSANIRELADELNLGRDSFIFLDDSWTECREVMLGCPQVLTLKLPEDPEQIPAYLGHVWAFDRFKVTEEDKKRSEMYSAEKKRQELQKEGLGLSEFLRGLELYMNMSLMREYQVDRVSQLTQRTNQFNLSTIRRTEKEIIELSSEEGVKCWTVEVSDRFGDYGLVGVVITREDRRSLFIDTFLLSCRVLGRGMEDAILKILGLYCKENGIGQLEADFYPTQKNKPFLEFIERTKWIGGKKGEGCTKFTLDVSSVSPKTDYIDIVYDWTERHSKPGKNEPETTEKRPMINNEEYSYSEVVLDHVAVAVWDMDKARRFYSLYGYECGEVVHDPIQNVYLAMCTREGYDSIELVAPSDEDSPPVRILNRNGEIPYHFCFKVKDCRSFLNCLQKGSIAYEMVSEAKPAVLFNNKEVTFIYVKGVGLIELLEDTDIRVEGGIKDNSTRLIVMEPDAAVNFYRHMGYTDEKRKKGKSEGLQVISMTKAGAGRIEILIPNGQTGDEYRFFKKNGPHLHSMSFGIKDNLPADTRKRDSALKISNCWRVDIVNSDKLLHANHLLPLENYNAKLLLRLSVNSTYAGKIQGEDCNADNACVKETDFKAPVNHIEEKLVEIWKEVLGISQISTDSKFGDLGGDSFKAISIASEASRNNLNITVNDIFKYRTISGIAGSIKNKDEEESKPAIPTEQNVYGGFSYISNPAGNSVTGAREKGMTGLTKELFEYLGELIDTAAVSVQFPGDRDCILNSWFVKSEPAGDFDCQGPEPNLSMNGKLLLKGEGGNSPDEDQEKNWRHFTSREYISFYRYNAPQDIFSDNQSKYIYCVCSVYLSEEKDILLHSHTLVPSPMRIWINGNLVFTNSFRYVVEKNFLMYRFKKGKNIILVERMLPGKEVMPPLRMNVFTIELKPFDTFFDRKPDNEFLSDKFQADINGSYAIIPDRAMFEQGKDISFIVLPKRFINEEKEKINISIKTSFGKEIACFDSSTSERITVGLDNSINGVLSIEVQGRCSGKKSSLFVFRGDWSQERTRMLSIAKERCGQDIINTMEMLTDIPDSTTYHIKGYVEFINDTIYQHIQEKCFELEKYLDSHPGKCVGKLTEVFGSNFTVFKDMGIEGASLAYTIHLPKCYTLGKSYPLVVYIMYGYGAATFPDPPMFVSRGDFAEAISLSVCARGEQNRDYIYEANLIDTINQIVKEYNIPRNRVYAIGVCTGALRTINLALRFPSLFSAVAAFGGMARLDDNNPEYEYVENMDNLMFYQLCNIDDYTFNSARIMKILSYMKNYKKFFFHSFGHNEFQDLLNTEVLMNKLIKEIKTEYPRHIKYTTYEPIYNKSYWIGVEHMEDLRYPASVEARIEARSSINIHTINVKYLSVYINMEAMGLDEYLEFCVNGIMQRVKVESYSRVFVTIEGDTTRYEVFPYNRQEFEEEYWQVRVDEKLMGIKQIYFKNCMVIKPDYIKEYAKRLIGLLRSPLKEKNRNYKCELVNEDEVNESILESNNFIYVCDCIEKQEVLFGETWENASIEFDMQGISYRNDKFTGDYFALVKCNNPYNSGRFALLAVYNSIKACLKLVDFLETFDKNPLFYSQAVIYNDGSYYSFR